MKFNSAAINVCVTLACFIRYNEGRNFLQQFNFCDNFSEDRANKSRTKLVVQRRCENIGHTIDVVLLLHTVPDNVFKNGKLILPFMKQPKSTFNSHN